MTAHTRGEYARGEAHSNTVESSFSLLKRGLIGTFHHVGEQHLQGFDDVLRRMLETPPDPQKAPAVRKAVKKVKKK